jgi:hypothetical protein
MEIILLLLAVIVVYYLTKTEPYTSSTTSTIDSSYEETIATLTPDENQAMIFATRDYLKKYLKLCAYCIDTVSVKKYVDGKGKGKSVKYRAAYMFMIQGGYPYGLSVYSEMTMTPKPTVLFLTTQPLTTPSDAQIVPFTDETGKTFLSYDQVLAAVAPKKLPTVK